MRTGRLIPKVLLGAVAVTCLLPVASATADAGRIGSVQVSEQQLRTTFSSRVPAEEALDPASVTVTLDGRAVRSTATSTTAQPAPVARSVMVLMDTSGSMRGDRLREAQSAARAFLADLPAEVAVGLTTFSDEVRMVARPTLDRSSIRRAVADLQARGSTRVYDGVIAAVEGLGSSTERMVILLSDGANSGSRATNAEASAALRRTGTALSAVGLGVDQSATAELEQLVAAGRGRLVTADDRAQLTEAFKAAAREFDQRLVVQAETPADVAGRTVALRISARSGSTEVDTVQVELPITLGARAQQAAQPWFSTGPALQWGAGLLLLGLVTVLALLVLPGERPGRRAGTQQLLEAYTLRANRPGDQPSAGRLGDSPVAQSLLALAGRLLVRSGRGEKLALRLDQAGMALQPRDWLLVQCAAGLICGTLLALLGGAGALGWLLGTALGAAAAAGYLRMRGGRRRAAFQDGLPDALQLVTSGLATGYSLAQALDTVVRDGAQPVSGEIGRALAESRLGVQLEDALDNVAARMESEDMGWVVMAVRVQREVGGNLAEVLDTVFETMRERARIRRQVRTLSAEGRMSGWVLIALPVFMGLFQLLFRRDYLRPLYTERVGIMMLGFTVVSVVIGAAWIKKLVTVET